MISSTPSYNPLQIKPDHRLLEPLVLVLLMSPKKSMEDEEHLIYLFIIYQSLIWQKQNKIISYHSGNMLLTYIFGSGFSAKNAASAYRAMRI